MEEKSEKFWNITVVRRLFLQTAMEQLQDASTEDWEKPIHVRFIGEEGIDAGRVSREFFSLLFRETDTFEGNNFSFNPLHLEKKVYCLLGKAVAKAIVSGHPGPRRLNKIITTYILTGEEPDFRNVTVEDIHRGDVASAVMEIENASDQNIQEVFAKNADILDSTGYTKRLTLDNRSEACTALKSYFLLYRIIAPLLQFMDGGTVTVTWIDPYNGNEDHTVINVGHVLQGLVGSSCWPTDMSGTIEFDHSSVKLSTLNTCVSSISFSMTNEIQNYSQLEETVLNMIVGADGFGNA